MQDHVEKDLTEQGAATLFSDVLESWTEYKDVPGTRNRQWVFDNELMLVSLLYKALRRCGAEKGKEVLTAAIKRHLCSGILCRLIANLGKMLGKFGGNEELAEAFCSEIQNIVDAETIQESGTLCRMIYFVAEIAPARLPLLLSRLRKSSTGLIAIISYGLQETIPITLSKEHEHDRFIVNLSEVSKVIDPSELVQEVQASLIREKLDDRSTEIARTFLKAWQTSQNRPTPAGKSDIADHDSYSTFQHSIHAIHTTTADEHGNKYAFSDNFLQVRAYLPCMFFQLCEANCIIRCFY